MNRSFFKNSAKKFLKSFSSVEKVDKHGFEYTVKELIGMHENSISSVRYHGKLLSDEILKYKESDTVYILGSGPSINNITAEQWKSIGANDSIGFNYWLVHDYIPKFYVFQGFTESMLRLFKDKYKYYKEIPFIIRGSTFAKTDSNDLDNSLQLFKNNDVFYLREYPIHSSCSIEPSLLIKYLEAIDLMPHGSVSKFIPKLRGTLGLLIVLSYQMGYKRIVLCGMDMHSSDHFWDYNPYEKIRTKYKLPGIGSANIETFTDKNRSPNTVPVYVKALRDWMLEKNNVEISVINKKTLLYPEIPLFFK